MPGSAAGEFIAHKNRILPGGDSNFNSEYDLDFFDE